MNQHAKRMKSLHDAKGILELGNADGALVEVASHFIQIVGGPRKFANMLYHEFLNAKEGSLVRQRVMELILRVWKMSESSRGSAANLALLSEDDLTALLADQIKHIKLPAPSAPTEENSDASSGTVI